MLRLEELFRGLVLFFAVFLLTACGAGKDNPVGKWVYSDKGASLTAEFTKDHTFLMTAEAGADYSDVDKATAQAQSGIAVSGKWQAMEDKRIVVNYNAGGTQVFRFEGESLVMKKNGNVISFKRVDRARGNR